VDKSLSAIFTAACVVVHFGVLVRKVYTVDYTCDSAALPIDGSTAHSKTSIFVRGVLFCFVLLRNPMKVTNRNRRLKYSIYILNIILELCRDAAVILFSPKPGNELHFSTSGYLCFFFFFNARIKVCGEHKPKLCSCFILLHKIHQ